ncbi:MAG TPA: Crp/Fnr family transcriptional regulator [Sediminibacterium sp.]|nr:Crp/Fnr family transcriptional regulator [Sediminibacterium sp.]
MKKRQQADDNLAGSMLYAYCLPEWRRVLEAQQEIRRIKKGRTIFCEGEPVTGVFFICSGKVKIHQPWGEDKELIIRFAAENDMIGYRGLGKTRVHPVTATALENTVCCFIPADLFEATLQVNARFTYELMHFYADELQETERRMRDMAHMEVKGRVAATLLMLRDKFKTNRHGHLNVVLTRQDMASYAGTTYETFFRAMNELLKEKLIRVSGKAIVLLRPEQLAVLADTGRLRKSKPGKAGIKRPAQK